MSLEFGKFPRELGIFGEKKEKSVCDPVIQVPEGLRSRARNGRAFASQRDLGEPDSQSAESHWALAVRRRSSVAEPIG